MSFQAMNLVSQLKKCDIAEINTSKFTAGVKCLLFSMANYCDKDFQFYPSRQTLADDVGCCVKAIDNYNNYLIELGLIAKSSRKGKNGNSSNMYELRVGQFLKKNGYTITMNEKGFLTAVKEKHTASPLETRGESDSLGGVTNSLGGEYVTPDPVTDPITNPKDLNLCPSDDRPTNSIIDISFKILWDVWPNTKQRIRAVKSYKAVLRKQKLKSPDSIKNFACELKADITERLRLTHGVFDDGFRNSMLSTYINGYGWQEALPAKPENVSHTDEAKQKNSNKGNDLLKQYGYK